MTVAKRAILNCHAITKEFDQEYDIALCHAVRKGYSTVHVETFAGIAPIPNEITEEKN